MPENEYIEGQDEEVTGEEEIPEEDGLESEVASIPETSIPEPVDPLFLPAAAPSAGEYSSPKFAVVRKPVEESVESATTEANGEDISDMFRAPLPDDLDVNVEDLVSVSDEDIFGDGGEDMSDILEVTEEDVTGEGETDVEDLVAPEKEDDLSDLFNTPEPDSVEDLVSVSNEDVMGYPGTPPEQDSGPSRRNPKRPSSDRNSPAPHTALGGVRR